MEAAEEYVGHRAVEYNSASDRLSRAANGEIPPDQLQKWIEDTRKQYDNAIQQKVFGGVSIAVVLILQSHHQWNNNL